MAMDTLYVLAILLFRFYFSMLLPQNSSLTVLQFKEHFLKAGSEGGVKAARELSDSVRELMHSTMGMQADSCRIMVRVYANILGLSKALARAGMVGHEARSLSPFTSSFTRAQDLFDFVDAAEKKEGSDFKIRGMHLHLVDLMFISC